MRFVFLAFAFVPLLVFAEHGEPTRPVAPPSRAVDPALKSLLDQCLDLKAALDKQKAANQRDFDKLFESMNEMAARGAAENKKAIEGGDPILNSIAKLAYIKQIEAHVVEHERQLNGKSLTSAERKYHEKSLAAAREYLDGLKGRTSKK